MPTSKRLRIPTGAMLPTLQVGQYVDVDLLAYLTSSPKHGDIVVFPAPRDALHANQGMVFFFKRCIGLPGDLIEIKSGVLFRNEKAVQEAYVAALDFSGKPIREEEVKHYQRDFKLVKRGDAYWPLSIDGDLVNGELGRTSEKYFIEDSEEMGRLLALPAARVPEGYCIVMGDNRLNSADSRSWGLVDLNTVVGKVRL